MSTEVARVMSSGGGDPWGEHQRARAMLEEAVRSEAAASEVVERPHS